MAWSTLHACMHHVVKYNTSTLFDENRILTENSETSSVGILSSFAESMTSVRAFIFLDERSEVDHSEVTIHLDSVLKLMVPGAKHPRRATVLIQPLFTV